MAMIQAKLTKKIHLTHDVYELHYQLSEEKSMKPGQFLTFILPGVGGRSYSVLELRGNIAILIIKKWPRETGGRGGSIILCDADIGDEYQCVGPAGHFLLQDNTENKLFIGTGTGLVPLYNQILEGLKKNTGEKYQLVFGVRYLKDMFYQKEFEALKKQYPDTFYYHLVVSRDQGEGMIKKGYVTDFLSKNVADQYGEYYLCGAPAMIESCQEKLLDLGVDTKNVYFEKYA
ncbi:FAD-binding oxidoreductase [Candidatus Gracilibacteria bacterium]|nr:FAD-binding oxidoreductase [Candidatus Gracilibacteria bacterium]